MSDATELDAEPVHTHTRRAAAVPDDLELRLRHRPTREGAAMRILVTGATSNIGRMVVDELTGADYEVRALTVDPARADLPAGVEVAVGFVGNPSTCGQALADVDRMYLAPMPDTAVEVTQMAARAGVERIVDLSGEPESWWSQVTHAVEDSGVAWTHLWPGDFMENYTAWTEQIRRTGAIRDAYPMAASAPIAMHDVARVAAVALLRDDLIGKALSLTGPETLTRREAAGQIIAALDQDVSYIEVTRQEAAAQLEPSMGEHTGWYLDILADLTAHPYHANSLVTDLTGRATTVAEWALSHRDAFQ